MRSSVTAPSTTVDACVTPPPGHTRLPRTAGQHARKRRRSTRMRRVRALAGTRACARERAPVRLAGGREWAGGPPRAGHMVSYAPLTDSKKSRLSEKTVDRIRMCGGCEYLGKTVDKSIKYVLYGQLLLRQLSVQSTVSVQVVRTRGEL